MQRIQRDHYLPMMVGATKEDYVGRKGLSQRVSAMEFLFMLSLSCSKSVDSS